MGDQDRLLGSTNGGEELERELLESLRDVSPRLGAKDETWNRLAVQVAAAATISASGAAAHAVAHSAVGAAVQATKVATAKVVMGVALAGSAVAGGGWWVHQKLAATQIAPPVEHVAPPSPPAPRAPTLESQEPIAPVVTPPPEVPERTPKGGAETRPRTDSLSLESRLLTEARGQLRGGDPRGALATLERLRARSPKGVLTQERDVLAIQIASALGDVAAAKRKAKEFLDAYPESPHAPQVRRLVADP